MDEDIPEEYSTAIFSEFAKQRRILDKYTKKNLKHGLAYSIRLVYTGEIAFEMVHSEDLFDSLKVKTDESDDENEEKCKNMLETIGFKNITLILSRNANSCIFNDYYQVNLIPRIDNSILHTDFY